MFGEARFKPRQNSHQGQFARKREKERRWEQSVEGIAATDKVIAFANWENKTAGAIASRAGTDRVRSLEGADADALLARRRRVADLYNREMEQWEHEILNSAETMEERKTRILEKATKLKNAREAARRNYVQECYDRQWRDACDDARTLDSKANTEWVTAQRWEQVAEKAAREEENARQEELHMAKIRERIAYLEAQEKAAEEKRERRNQLMRSDLNTQVAYNADRRRQLWEQTARDDLKELNELRAIVRAEQEKTEAKKKEAHARGAEVRDFNEARREMRVEAAEQAREQDLVLLEYAIEKDKAGEAEEKAKKEEEQRVLRQYNEYLKEQMAKEAADEAQYDEIRQEAETRIWDQRDAQLKAQNDAREALMKQVHRGRQEQIRLKALRDDEQLATDLEQARLDRESFLAEEEREREKEMRKRQELLDNTAKLREQMTGARARAEREQQEEYLRVKQMEAYERRHRERLEKQAGVVITHHPLKHTQWYT
ncbi:unnamed protein product [Ectocarpus sp. 12 AP-2014]